MSMLNRSDAASHKSNLHWLTLWTRNGFMRGSRSTFMDKELDLTQGCVEVVKVKQQKFEM